MNENDDKIAIEINWEELNQTYQAVSWHGSPPNVVITSAAGWKYLYGKFAGEPEAHDDYDEFDEWVKDVRKKAKEPKNKGLRKFLATNRWERR